MIIRGGENIHPLDVEDCLLGHPALQEISAYGVPDDRYGETIAVSIIRRQDCEVSEEEIRAWVKEKLSGHFGELRLPRIRLFQGNSLMNNRIWLTIYWLQVPKHIFWVDNLPKTASGKIQRFKLQQDAIEKLGLKTKS